MTGGLAQLGERYNGIVEVRGSSPLSSTLKNPRTGRGNCGARHFLSPRQSNRFLFFRHKMPILQGNFRKQ